MICESCQDIFRGVSKPGAVEFDSKWRNYEFKQERLWSYIREAAANNCLICQKIVDDSAPDSGLLSLLTAQKTESCKPVLISSTMKWLNGLNYYPLNIYLENRLTAAFCIYTNDEFYFPSSHNTGSQDCIELIKRWMNDCKKNHSRCQSPKSQQSKKWYPTRLIDLGPTDSPCFDPRLIKCAEMDVAIDYATLSHRWASSVPVKLTLDDFDSFKKKIPSSELPQTFKGAFAISKRLGLRYIWIDSLCIIQGETGNSTDWDIESSMMGRVYEGAVCNLAATGAQEGRQGLFNERNPDTIGTEQVEIDWPEEKSRQMSQLWKRLRQETESVKKHRLIPSKLFERGVEGSELVSRGWIFQERLLAKRVIHFGANQIFWECNELQACEAASEPFQNHVRARKPSAYPPGGANSLDGVRDTFWKDLTVRYTGCQLTKDEDKLVAIAGLAERFNFPKREGGNLGSYLAGHWSAHLPRSLLWYGQFQTPSCYRAPSWAWPSMNGRITYVEISDKHSRERWVDEATVTCWEVSSDPQNKYGQVSNGWILIRARLSLLSSSRWPVVATLYDLRDFDNANNDVYMMPIVKKIYSSKNPHHVNGLLLVRALARPEAFRRVGLFYHTFEELEFEEIFAKVRNVKIL